MGQICPDILSKVFLMFLGDFSLTQVDAYVEKISSMLPEETNMVIGVFQETNSLADTLEDELADMCDNPDITDYIYAEVVCLMV